MLVVTQRYPRSLPAKQVIDGIPVHRILAFRPDAAMLRNSRFDLFLYGVLTWHWKKRAFLSMLRAFNPDVINIHFPDWQIHLLRSMLNGTKKTCLVTSIHGHDIERYHSEHTKSQGNAGEGLAAVLQFSEAVVTCSEYMKGRTLHAFPECPRIHVIPNGVEAATARSANEENIIVASGRFVQNKGFDILLHAFAVIADKFKDWSLRIVGDGERRNILEKIAAAHCISDRVDFTGKMSREQTLAIVRSAAFVVIPSRKEGFGVVALEAMREGKAVIASNVGGLPEILANTGNALVPPDSDALAKAMMEYILFPEKRMRIGNENLLHVKRFSVQRFLDSYEALYSSVLKTDRNEALPEKKNPKSDTRFALNQHSGSRRAGEQ